MQESLKATQSTLLEVNPSKFSGAEILSNPVLKEALSMDNVEVVLDFETTGKTPWASAVDTGKIGGRFTQRQYIKQFGGTINKDLRARILSISIPTKGLSAAVDLDMLSKDEKYELAGSLSGQIWVGHNLLFDYQWMLTLNPDVRPSRIIDTMLMITALRPDAMYKMQGLVVQQTLGGDTKRKHYAELESRAKIRSAKKEMSGGSMSLNDLALWLFDEKLDKSYQKPINWMPTVLSDEHYDYCLGDVDLPQRAARNLLKLKLESPISDVLKKINLHKGGEAYENMEAALHKLVRMQRKGLYWSSSAATQLIADLKEEATKAMDKLEALAPTISSVRDKLLDPDAGLDEEVKKAISKTIERATGQAMPTTKKGNLSLNADSLKVAFPDSPVVEALQDVFKPVGEMKKVAQYAAVVAEDGRIHPLTGISTITGRTSSQEPNMQNIPRDPRFRALFAAPTGYQIVATDFSSIELRIAAALGVRAWRNLMAIKAGLGGDMKMQSKMEPQINKLQWLFKEVPLLRTYLMNPTVEIPNRIATANPHPSIYDKPDVSQWAYAAAHQLCTIISKILKVSDGDEARLPFRHAYAQGLDPHIITALAMEAQGKRFDLKGMLPINYAASLSKTERSDLKKTLAEPRQAAKAVGFGLVYGMSDASLHTYGIQGYGLSWSKQDASLAKDAYFDLFPEIALWHWMLKNLFNYKADILNPYNANECRSLEEGGKLFVWSTLSNRPTIASKLTSGTNYQDQGTGAEIAFRTLNQMPEDLQGMLINFVHDEFMLEVPTDKVPEVQAILEKTMIESADWFLMPFGVPTEVESSVGDCWIH